MNLSWINNDILEIVVLSSYTTKLKEKISIISSLSVLENFDPLNPKSYNPDIEQSNVKYDAMRKSLRRAMIKRLAHSSNDSSNSKTKDYIRDWIGKRGWSNEFKVQLTKSRNSYANAPSMLSSILVSISKSCSL